MEWYQSARVEGCRKRRNHQNQGRRLCANAFDSTASSILRVDAVAPYVQAEQLGRLRVIGGYVLDERLLLRLYKLNRVSCATNESPTKWAVGDLQMCRCGIPREPSLC